MHSAICLLGDKDAIKQLLDSMYDLFQQVLETDHNDTKHILHFALEQIQLITKNVPEYFGEMTLKLNAVDKTELDTSSKFLILNIIESQT